jgi:hypothetical protein
MAKNMADTDTAHNITRAQLAELSQDTGVNPSANPTIGDVIASRFSRRDLVKGALGVAAIAATTGTIALDSAKAQGAGAASRYRFDEVEAKVDQNHAVANGYDADILIRWGDPVLPDAPAFNPQAQTANAQVKQFGYNNDFLGYFPMPGAANPSAHGLLVVNHEFTNEELMFPDIGRQDRPSSATGRDLRQGQSVPSAWTRRCGAHTSSWLPPTTFHSRASPRSPSRRGRPSQSPRAPASSLRTQRCADPADQCPETSVPHW